MIFMEGSREFIPKIKKDLDKLAEVFQSELINQKEIITELKARLNEKEYSKDKVEALKKEFQDLKDKFGKLKLEKNKEIREANEKITQLAEDNEKLERKLRGFRKTINIVSNWVEERKESIDVLISLCEGLSNIEEISKETMIPAVVLKNRVIPMLLEKNLVLFDDDLNNLNLK